MKKMPIYEIFKINSERLDRNDYNITLTYEQAMINAEIVGLSSSQTLRKLREIKGYKEDDLFIKEYLSIKVDKQSHYKTIKKRKGIIVNGHKFVRFGCSAGNARSEIVFMIREDVYDAMHKIMLCDVKPFKMVEAKYSTYYTLNSSSTHPIREPRVVVLPDYTLTLNHTFDWIDENGDITTKQMDIEDYPPFDGQGLVDINFAKLMAKDIELTYTPSAFVIRNTFIKGGVIVMDFKKFAREIANKNELIADLWGNVYNINDIDMILTESQFKLWQGYDSWESYVQSSRKYGLSWGVTKFTHEYDNTHAFTNYQFLQVLDLDEKQIENICKPTIDWVSDITGKDVMKSILYMCGTEKKININNIQDPSMLALLYNNDLIEDSYIKTKIIRSINKKIRQAYSGKLLLHGNFSHMASDPYALLEYAFGLPVRGLLSDMEHYNGFWNTHQETQVCAMRSPLTHYSEVNILNLINNEKTKEWYQHINKCVTVLNIFGNDTMKFADSDFDGDLVFTSNQKELIDGVVPNQYPITFNKKSAKKKKIKEHLLYNVDMLSFGTKIGFITNCSTAMYAMLPLFEENSEEHNELLKRLKYCRKLQGQEIDKSKGIKIDPFPKSWTNKKHTTTELDKNVLITKKPYFQRYVYPHVNKEYNEYKNNISMYSLRKYGKPVEENNNKEFIELVNSQNPVLETSSTMNSICYHLEKNIKEIKSDRQKQDVDLIKNILMDNSRDLLVEYIPFIKSILNEYKQFRKNERSCNLNHKMAQTRFNIYCKNLKANVYKTLKNPTDIANLVVYVCYATKIQENKDFAWNVFGEEILNNVIKNKQDNIYVPIEDKNGDIEYLGKKYKKTKVRFL